MDRLTDELGDCAGGHALEHRPVRVRVCRQERAVEALRPELRPGDLEEPDEAGVVDGGDRGLAVVGRWDESEPAVSLERDTDPLGALSDLIRGHGHAHERLERDVVPEVRRRIDDLHRTIRAR